MARHGPVRGGAKTWGESGGVVFREGGEVCFRSAITRRRPGAAGPTAGPRRCGAAGRWPGRPWSDPRSGPWPPGGGRVVVRRHAQPRCRRPRQEQGHEPVPRAPRASPLLRGAAHAVLAPRYLAVARPLMATRTPFHSDPPMRTRHPCQGDGQRRRVPHAPVPRRGVRRGVLHLRVLLPGAGLLRG